MPTKKAPEYADDLDLTLFNAARGLESLAAMTGDKALTKAAQIVASQRPQVRAHMTEVRRKETEGN